MRLLHVALPGVNKQQLRRQVGRGKRVVLGSHGCLLLRVPLKSQVPHGQLVVCRGGRGVAGAR